MTVSVLWLFLMVPWVGLQCVIMVFPDHIHMLFFIIQARSQAEARKLWLQHDQRLCYSLSEKKSIFNYPYFGGLQHDKASGYAPVICIDL